MKLQHYLITALLISTATPWTVYAQTVAEPDVIAAEAVENQKEVQWQDNLIQEAQNG